MNLLKVLGIAILTALLNPIVATAQPAQWNTLEDLEGEGPFYRIIAQPNDPDILLAAAETGLYRSTNSGEDWTRVVDRAARDVWVHPNGDYILYLYSEGSRSDGIWISRNNGQNWEVYTWIIWPSAITVNREDHDQVFCGNLQGRITFTMNGGQNWSDGNNGLPNSEITHLDIVNGGANHMFASTDRGVYHCVIDNELNWEHVGPHNLPVRQISIDPENFPGIYAGTDDESDSDGIYFTENLGGDWEVVRWMAYVTAVDALNGVVLAASGEVGVGRVEDDEWIEMNRGLPENAVVSDFLTIVIGEEPIYYCCDGNNAYRFGEGAEEQVPSDFELLLPADGDTLEPGEVEFVWQSSTDPDGDVVYDWLVLSDEIELSHLSLEDTTLSADLDELQTELNYTWVVYASSDGDTVRCDDAFTFCLREPEQPPSAFTLIQPPDSVVVEHPVLTFIWNRSIDPNPEDTVSYAWFISDGVESISHLTYDTILIVTLFEMPNLTNEVTYQWWVVAEAGGDQTECEARFHLTPRIEDVPPDGVQPPVDFGIIAAYPNPFNRQVVLNLAIPMGLSAELRIIDLQGRNLLQVRLAQSSTGWKQFVWQPVGGAGGVYLAQLQAGDKIAGCALVYLP